MKIKNSLRLATASFALGMSCAAHAADPVAAPAGGDQDTTQSTAASIEGEITVTARRVEERVQDIPLAVTAMSGDQLRRRSVGDIRDLSASAPNLIIQQGNSDAQSAVVTIRGQSQSNVLLSVDGAVGVYIDDVNNPRAYGLRAGLLDIKRVEVLRGPQGTLYGRNTTGGAVSIFTNDPTPDFGGSLQLGVGNYSARNALGILNIPIDDGVGVRLVGQYDYHHGYGYAPLSPGADPQRSDGYYLRGKLKIDKGPVSFSLTGDIFNYNTGNKIDILAGLVNGAVAPNASDPTAPRATVLGGQSAREVQLELGLPNTVEGLQAASDVLASYVKKGSFYQTNSGSPMDAVGKGGSLAMKLEVDLSDALTLRSISGYRHYVRHAPGDQDSTPFLINLSSQNVADDFYSQETQLLGSMGRLNWVVGAFYSKEEGIESFFSQSLVLRSGNALPITQGTAISKSYAFFGQGNYKITDALTLTLGARWTKETKIVINRNRTVAASGAVSCSITGAAAAAFLDTPGVCQATFNNSYSDPSWIASLAYAVNDDVNVYGKVSRGFRGGGQQLRAQGANPDTYQPYRPETVTEYELGVKTELFDRRVQFNLAAFYDKYDDVQRSVTFLVNGAVVTAVQNAAKARVWGIEAETRATVTPNFFLNSTIGYLNAKYINFADFSGPGATLRDRTGEAWPAPDWNVSVGGTYVAPLSFGDATLNVGYSWQSKQNLQPQALMTSHFIQKAFGLLNARLSVSVKDLDLEFAVFGRNLTGTKYYTSGITLESLGFNVLQPGDPRVVGFQVTKKF
ncbi:MAG: TonB-dependent receptor [Sphingobium sp.]